MDNRHCRRCRNREEGEFPSTDRRNCTRSANELNNRCRRDLVGDALEDAYNQGYRDGYPDGFEDGRTLGAQEGFQQGYRAGCERARREVLEQVRRNRCCCRC